MLSEVIEAAATKKREELREKYATYRKMLEKFNAGTLSTADGEALAALVSDLQIPPADAQKHAEALASHGQLLTKLATRPTLKKELDELNPKIRQLADDRAAIIAKLDTEINPLLYRAREIENSISQLDISENWGLEREPLRYPALFGRGFEARVERPQPTERQQAESRHRGEVWQIWCAVRKELLEMKSRKKFHDHVNDAITYAFRFGKEVSAEPLVFSPPDNQRWPTAADGYSAAVITDPRRRTVLAKAKEIKALEKQRDFKFSNISDDGRQLISLGRRMGWIDSSCDALTDPDENADEEAAAE